MRTKTHIIIQSIGLIFMPIVLSFLYYKIGSRVPSMDNPS